MPQRIGKALAYAIVIWIIGFVWGSIVFMTPSLKSVRPIPLHLEQSCDQLSDSNCLAARDISPGKELSESVF